MRVINKAWTLAGHVNCAPTCVHNLVCDESEVDGDVDMTGQAPKSSAGAKSGEPAAGAGNAGSAAVVMDTFKTLIGALEKIHDAAPTKEKKEKLMMRDIETVLLHWQHLLAKSQDKENISQMSEQRKKARQRLVKGARNATRTNA